MYFSLSKQSYVNEIADDPWHLRMLFVEFVEVLCRTAEKIPYETLKTRLVGLEKDKGKDEEEILKLNIHEEVSENSSNEEKSGDEEEKAGKSTKHQLVPQSSKRNLLNGGASGNERLRN